MTLVDGLAGSLETGDIEPGDRRLGVVALGAVSLCEALRAGKGEVFSGQRRRRDDKKKEPAHGSQNISQDPLDRSR